MFPKTLVILILFHHALSQDDAYDGIFDTDGSSSTETTTTDADYDGIWDTGTMDENNRPTTTVTSRFSENVTIIPAGNEECECIPYYLCDSRFTASKQKEHYGDGLIDTRISKRVECPHYLLKCCDDEDLSELEPEEATPQPSTTPEPTEPLKPQGCGYTTFSTSSTDGAAEFGEFPWTVAIYYSNSTTDMHHVCGGTLIHPGVVLTAAHCIKDIKKQPKVRAGVWDSQTQTHTNTKYPHQDRDVASIAIHARFSSVSFNNDIALLFLKKPFDLAPHINVVCLAPPDTIVDNMRCISNGWEKHSLIKNSVLTKIELPMVPRMQCERYLRRTKLGRLFMLHGSFVCAGGESGRDACDGDGGSPLVCPVQGQKDRYFQMGIVSWGVGCGGYKVPGVYVNIPLFRGWIDEKLKRKNFDVSVYQV